MAEETKPAPNITASEGLSPSETVMFGAGFVSSAMMGYLAIRFLLNFLVNHSLRAFAYYRFGLAFVVAMFLLASNP